MNLTGRRKLRNRFRDLAAGSAFAAVALSGTVPFFVTGLFGVAWVVSMLGFRPLGGRRAWSVVVLLIIAAVLFGAAFRGVLNLVIAAVSFAALVTAHRMLSEPGPSTDQQVLLASLLLISGAAALSGELWFAGCLLLFGVFGSLTLALTTIEGPEEREGELPVRPLLRQLSVGVFFALLGGLAFFILFPRLSWNVAARRIPPGLLGGTSGMSDRVTLGGAGSIKTSARVVMRAELQPDPGGDELDRYWLGRTFDTFDGREWRGSGRERAPQYRVQVAHSGGSYVIQRIELLPAYGSRTLIALEEPILFDGAQSQSTAGAAPVQLVLVEGEEVHFASVGNAFTYTAYSAPHSTAHQSDPEPGARSLQLPDSLNPRVAQLARQLAGPLTQPTAIARALESHLRDKFAYSLELEGDAQDPLSDFLFQRKAGHCEHFATALTVMLRTLGVPARVAAGFYGGERVGRHFAVRAGDAHAWTQAWIAGRGWVDFDATPSEGRRNQPTALLAALTSLYERVEELWRANVVDYSITDQVSLMRSLVKPPQTAGDGRFSGEWSVSRRGIALAIAAALLAWAAVRLLLRAQPPRVHPAASFLDDIEAKLARAHISRQGGEPIEELTHRLARERHALAVPLSEAVTRYLEARFGARPLKPGERARLLERLGAPF